MLETCYGQLEHVYSVTFTDTNAQSHLRLKNSTLILTAIRQCVLTSRSAPGGLDIHYYERMGALDIVSVLTIQCLVGRVPAGNDGWAVIDRSGSLARAIAEDDGEDD